MKQTIFIILTLIALNLFGQKSEIENLINQITSNEVPENFNYYFLVSKSLEQSKIYDSLNNYEKRELGIDSKIIYEFNGEKSDWKNYTLENVKYVPDESINQTFPENSREVWFVKFKIKQYKYDSLIKNKKPNILIVRKKWYWNKKRVWEEIRKALKENEKQNIEGKIYFQFSKPVFSDDKKYAIVSVIINKRCNGKGFTFLYRNDNGIWKKLIEYNEMSSIRNCDFTFTLKN